MYIQLLNIWPRLTSYLRFPLWEPRRHCYLPHDTASKPILGWLFFRPRPVLCQIVIVRLGSYYTSNSIGHWRSRMDTSFSRLLVVEMNSHKIHCCMIDKNWFATIPKKNSSPTRFPVWRPDISVSPWSPSHDVIVTAHCRMVIIVVASPCQTAIARPPLHYLPGRYQEDHIKYHLHSFSKLAWVIHTEQLCLNPMPRH